MTRPKISTITSCYRTEKYLPLFLERLPQQTMFDSLQVVLDLSDPTATEVRLVEDFAKQYPGKLTYIFRENVVPIYTAWNSCVRQADADFLAIWNVDDLRTPDSLEQQYKALQNSEAGVVYGDFIVVPVFGECVGDFENRAGLASVEHLHTMRAGPFFMFRKSLCEKAGYFDEQFKSSADFDFCARLTFHTQFLHIPVNLGYYLNEGVGTSTKADSVQPVEDAVIALRYGMYDNLDYALLPRTSIYSVPQILQYGAWSPVAAYVPDWEGFLREQGQTLVFESMQKHVLSIYGDACGRGLRGAARNVLGGNGYDCLKKVWWRLRSR